MKSTVLQDSSSAQRRGEGSFGVAGHQSCISCRSPRALDNRDIESIAGTVASDFDQGSDLRQSTLGPGGVPRLPGILRTATRGWPIRSGVVRRHGEPLSRLGQPPAIPATRTRLKEPAVPSFVRVTTRGGYD